ncbi:glycosyltransferase family 8 protein [Pasteurellaceae bacterium 22721_9_1]
MERINIFLAADFNYSNQVETLIKSICCNDKHVDFYLLNKDYPKEWIKILSKKLDYFDSRILDVKVKQSLFSDLKFKHLPHISEAGLYRYLIPELPMDRSLYLDSDLVVTGSLKDMYFSDFSGYLLMAACDSGLNSRTHCGYIGHPDIKPYFNSGVMLINNQQWREENIEHELFTLTEYLTNNHPEVIYLDQDVLNIVLKGRWKILDESYNFQALPSTHCIEYLKQNDTPNIIHYVGPHKPWKLTNIDIPLREKYWHYYDLEWEEIRTYWK